jgi:alpha-N-acetylglucosaminidase
MGSSLSRRRLLSLPAGLAVARFAPKAFGTEPAPPASAVLRRLIGPRAADFDFQLRSDGPDRPWYRATSSQGAVRIEASDPIALTRGAYAYLKATGAAQMSWEGDRVALPDRFPDHDSGRVETPFGHRAYLNPCTYGYTMPWWDWPRWEREIDWMALHGIDLPLALEGQEHIWRLLWREAGLTDDEIAAHFSSAPFAPWQRMGNIEGYGPLSPRWIDKKRALQEKILARMGALGMTPILPAFAGYVPKAFAERHKEARIHQMRSWEGFPGTWWLDPIDPLFRQLSTHFLDLYGAAFGTGDYYLADSFNETLPPLTDAGADPPAPTYGDATANGAATPSVVAPAQRDARLSAYGKAIFDSIRQSRPDATWVMQGWLFGADRHFWTGEAISAFLSLVPDDKMMVLDIGNDRYPEVWTKAEAFHGKGWIYGYVHNYGGSNPLYGDLGYYQSDLKALLARQDTGRLAGFGVFPEGLYGSSVVYEYLFDLSWGSLDTPLENWLAAYLAARYGSVSPALLAAWNELVAACLRTRYWAPRWWRGEAGAYLLFKRPELALVEFEGHPGDPVALRGAARQLADLAPNFTASPLFQQDLAEVLRHFASLEIDRLLQKTLRAYLGADLTTADSSRATLDALVAAADLLAGSEIECLASWIIDARAYADNAADAVDYVRQAKTQVTLWGGTGNLHDYASKAWQGLYSDFYLPRWTLFFDALRRSVVTGESFDEAKTIAAIAAWEKSWIARDSAYRRNRVARPAEVAKSLFDVLEHGRGG